MDSVCSNSLHTPCIQTNDFLQDAHDFPQDRQNTYDDLISYPTAFDDLQDFSHTLQENLKAAAQLQPLPRVSHTYLSN
jgi:hypothetical protein